MPADQDGDSWREEQEQQEAEENEAHERALADRSRMYEDDNGQLHEFRAADLVPPESVTPPPPGKAGKLTPKQARMRDGYVARDGRKVKGWASVPRREGPSELQVAGDELDVRTDKAGRPALLKERCEDRSQDDAAKWLRDPANDPARTLEGVRSDVQKALDGAGIGDADRALALKPSGRPPKAPDARRAKRELRMGTRERIREAIRPLYEDKRWRHDHIAKALGCSEPTLRDLMDEHHWPEP